MADRAKRPNQKRRTRKDLLQAAARLMREGRKPSLEEVAEEALVSRATAYRYFPSLDALLVEAGIDIAVPDPAAFFAGDGSRDPVARVQRVDTMLHDMILAHEAQLRLMLAQSLQRGLDGHEGDVPPRQNRRTPLIEAALAPAEGEFDAERADTLSKALAFLIGPEGVVVAKDVLQLDDAEARRVKRWAIAALVDAARRGSPRE